MTVPGLNPRHVGLLFLTPLFASVLSPGPLYADSTWADPHPQRLQGLREGRDFDYNSESFLHRFSYRLLDERPGSGEDGLYGTAGSITGDELYLDISLQKTFLFDDQRTGFVARMQRREDFDGRFDRQLVGFTRLLGDHWSTSLLADLSADKGRSDLQLEATWEPDEKEPDEKRQLRLAAMQTDVFYNSKSVGGEYRDSPSTYFAHLQYPLFAGIDAEIAVNYSPTATFEDIGLVDRVFNEGPGEAGVRDEARITYSGEQMRVMAGARLPLAGSWETAIRAEVERTERDFSLEVISDAGAGPVSDAQTDRLSVIPTTDGFEREALRLTWEFAAPAHHLSPHGGLHFFDLDETGWFGSGLAASGTNQRREITVYAGVELHTGDRHHWQPTIYASKVDFDRVLVERPFHNRDENEWLGKISLAWRYLVSRESGAVLTINPTMRLHRLAFGGGNIQLTWPL